MSKNFFMVKDFSVNDTERYVYSLKKMQKVEILFYPRALIEKGYLTLFETWPLCPQRRLTLNQRTLSFK
jgi:hypothetical protein